MTISLLVGGKKFEGWTSARVTRSVESVSGAFSLTYTDRFSESGEVWEILQEDECTVQVDGQTVITGYVDERSLAFDANSRTLSVSGRDVTGQLVDCSADLDKWDFRTDLLTLAGRLCDPFGIEAVIDGVQEIQAIRRHSIDPGESSFEALERACRMSGMLCMTDGLGKLVLTRAGTERCTSKLVQGENILAASAQFNSADRYASYYVLTQHPGSDGMPGAAAAHIRGFAADATVKRTGRSLIIRSEGSGTLAYASARAKWEAAVRAGRSDTVEITVLGWTQADGTLWPVNKRVSVDAPAIGVKGDMLIASATYSVSDAGVITDLTLRPPDAFRPEPEIKKATRAGWAELEGGA